MMDSSYKTTSSMSWGDKLSENEAASIEALLGSLVEKIQECESIAHADHILTDLGAFQEELARILFKFNIPLKPKLRQLVREFDRPDDHDLRVYTFKKIKKGTFLEDAD
jgi:hypothetical protein